MGGAGQCHDPRLAASLGKLILNDLTHRQQGLVLNALGHIHNQLTIGNVRRSFFGSGAHKGGRHSKQQDIAVGAGLGNVGGIVHCGRQLHAGQVGVAVGGAEGFQLGGDGAPYRDILAMDGQQTRERDAPGACTEYCDFSHR